MKTLKPILALSCCVATAFVWRGVIRSSHSIHAEHAREAVTAVSNKEAPRQSAKKRERLRPGVEAALTLAKFDGRVELDRVLSCFEPILSAEEAVWMMAVAKNQTKSKDGTWSLNEKDWRQCFDRWAENAPLDAANFLEQKGLLGMSERSLPAALMRMWAKKDAHGVVAWAFAEPRRQVRVNWLHSFAGDMFEVGTNIDSFSLMSYLGTLKDASVPPNLLQTYVEEHGVDALRVWLEKNQDNLQPNTISSAARLIVNKNTDYRPTLEWLQSLNNSAKLSALVFMKPMQGWTEQNPIAAGEWLNRQATSEARNALIWSYAMGIAVDDASAAKAWAWQMSEKEVFSTFGIASPGGFSQSQLLEQLEMVESAVKSWQTGVGQPISTNPRGSGLLKFRPIQLKDSPSQPARMSILVREPGG